MSRLIDAERLRKDILNLQDCYNGFSDTYDKACIIGVIDEQPTIDPVKWIPVSERLPKEDGSYLVSGKWGSGKESVGDCEFSVEDGYFQTAWNFNVLAWMPLPEPYKEGQDERT